MATDLALCSVVVYTRHLFCLRERFLISATTPRIQKSNKYRDKTTMRIRQQETTEMLKLKKTNGLLWARPEPRHLAPTDLSLSVGAVIESESRPAPPACTKAGYKVINRDWVNYHACSLSCCIYVVSNLYISKTDFTKLSAKIIARIYIYFF